MNKQKKKSDKRNMKIIMSQSQPAMKQRGRSQAVLFHRKGNRNS